MTRWLMAPWLMLLLAACGSSSSASDAGNPFGFDFDRFDYNGVVPVPLSAFREDRKTNGDDDAGVAAVVGGEGVDDRRAFTMPANGQKNAFVAPVHR